jgi:uridine phosphorylase
VLLLFIDWLNKLQLYSSMAFQINTEVLLHSDGSVYHLRVKGNDIADHVLLVGDPGRAEMIASLFSSIEKRIQNREFLTITGRYLNTPITVLATGIGVDNMEIVVQELHIAANYDPQKGIFSGNRTLNLIRIGSSGTLQPDVEPGSTVLTEYAIGIDGLFNYYRDLHGVKDEEAAAAFVRQTAWPSQLPVPYIVPCTFALANKLDVADYKGFTVTAPGFFAPQGRTQPLSPAFPDLNRRIFSFDFRQKRVLNFEMEASALYSLGRSLGHRTLTLCMVLANRRNNTFLESYQPQMKEWIVRILDRISAF